MKNSKRSERRYKTYIKLKKVFTKLKHSTYYDSLDESDKKEVYKNARYLRDNITNCSCYMCGNPRYHWKNITIQELKALDDFKSQEY